LSAAGTSPAGARAPDHADRLLGDEREAKVTSSERIGSRHRAPQQEALEQDAEQRHAHGREKDRGAEAQPLRDLQRYVAPSRKNAPWRGDHPAHAEISDKPARSAGSSRQGRSVDDLFQQEEDLHYMLRACRSSVPSAD